MRNKDIKKLINIASDSEEQSVNSEEIKETLMGKISKSRIAKEYSEGETVAPIFVTGATKAKKYSFAKITAGAAAACLGIGAIGLAAYGNSYGSGQLPAFDSDSVSDTAQYAETDDPGSQADVTSAPESLDNTPANCEVFLLDGTFKAIQAPPYTDYSYAPNTYPVDYEVYLLDGTLVQRNTETGYMYFGQSIYSCSPIVKENGRLYFTGGGTKQDITDCISADDYFVAYYVNSATGLTHYFIVGGDLQEKYYGYIELFWLPDSNCAYYLFDYHTHIIMDDENGIPKSNTDWVDKTVQKISNRLKEKYPSLDIMDCGSGNVSEFK